MRSTYLIRRDVQSRKQHKRYCKMKEREEKDPEIRTRGRSGKV